MLIGAWLGPAWRCLAYRLSRRSARRLPLIHRARKCWLLHLLRLSSPRRQWASYFGAHHVLSKHLSTFRFVGRWCLYKQTNIVSSNSVMMIIAIMLMITVVMIAQKRKKQVIINCVYRTQTQTWSLLPLYAHAQLIAWYRNQATGVTKIKWVLTSANVNIPRNPWVKLTQTTPLELTAPGRPR